MVVPLFPFFSRTDILRMIDMKIQKLRCNIHNLVVNLNSLIDARHKHGLNTGDKSGYVRDIGALIGFLLHTQSPSTQFHFEDHLAEVCPDLSRAERTEAHVFYSLVFQLMKTQSLLFYGRYTASAIEGASCFDVIMDGSAQAHRCFKFTGVSNSDLIHSTIHSSSQMFQIPPFHSFTKLEIKSDPRSGTFFFFMANLLQEFRVRLELR